MTFIPPHRDESVETHLAGSGHTRPRQSLGPAGHGEGLARRKLGDGDAARTEGAGKVGQAARDDVHYKPAKVKVALLLKFKVAPSAHKEGRAFMT